MPESFSRIRVINESGIGPRRDLSGSDTADLILKLAAVSVVVVVVVVRRGVGRQNGGRGTGPWVSVTDS